ncbi:hypothetical protein Ahy_B08g092614 [Arachis hypogaea]|uniref:ATP-dependent DNA helicase n=1 Tax=Arachis hypogaea TaxID=3818 RepID=A0A444Y495_ARAHY|nr:hypothetical protein Ahy_B08g092614 [Arachis hypogaea]
MLCTVVMEQKEAYNKVIKTINEFEGGKMFLYNLISTKIKSKSKIILNMASSEIASLLLSNGRTAHSRFKISLTLLKVGDEILGDSLDVESEIKISMDMTFSDFDQAFDELIDFVFSDLVHSYLSSNYFNDRTILAPTLDILTLKIGVPVLLLRNIDQSNGLCNGYMTTGIFWYDNQQDLRTIVKNRGFVLTETDFYHQRYSL